jgi:hypothetical protein
MFKDTLYTLNNTQQEKKNIFWLSVNRTPIITCQVYCLTFRYLLFEHVFRNALCPKVKDCLYNNEKKSLVNRETGYGLEDQGSNPGRWRKLPFITTFQKALEPTKPLIPLVLEALFCGIKGQSMKLTTHLHLMPKCRMSKAYLSALYMPA